MGASSERRNAGNGRSVNRTSKWASLEKRAAIYIRDGFRCVYCGRSANGRKYRTHKTAIYPGLALDHVIPRSRGGTNESTNVVTACEDCNTHKSDRTVAEWLAQGDLYTRRNLDGIHERISRALTTPIDLRAGKEHVGVRATRPLPGYERPRRERHSHEETPF